MAAIAIPIIIALEEAIVAAAATATAIIAGKGLSEATEKFVAANQAIPAEKISPERGCAGNAAQMSAAEIDKKIQNIDEQIQNQKEGIVEIGKKLDKAREEKKLVEKMIAAEPISDRLGSPLPQKLSDLEKEINDLREENFSAHDKWGELNKEKKALQEEKAKRAKRAEELRETQKQAEAKNKTATDKAAKDKAKALADKASKDKAIEKAMQEEEAKYMKNHDGDRMPPYLKDMYRNAISKKINES